MVMTTDHIRVVLAAVEAQPAGSTSELLIEGEQIPPKSDLDEAARYCIDSGYIELWTTPDRFGGSTVWLVKRLTATGHNKLRSLRGQEPL